jgi:hypothetical protein
MATQHTWLDGVAKRLARDTVSRRRLLARLGLALGGAGWLATRARDAYAQDCMLTCPANIMQSADSGMCGATVTYMSPTGIDCDGEASGAGAGEAVRGHLCSAHGHRL